MSEKEITALLDVGTALGYVGQELQKFVSDERTKIDREKEKEKERKREEKEKKRNVRKKKKSVSVRKRRRKEPLSLKS